MPVDNEDHRSKMWMSPIRPNLVHDYQKSQQIRVISTLLMAYETTSNKKTNGIILF